MSHFYTNSLSGVIFDLDNTLVSSTIDFAAIRKQIRCPKDQDILAYVDGLVGKKKADAETCIIEHEIEDAKKSVKLHGTDELLDVLNRNEIPTAIVTRNCREASEHKVKKLDIDIDCLLTREEHKAKPSPEGLLHISTQWQLLPTQLLYVGDYLYDIQAAANADMKSCLVTMGRQLDFAHQASFLTDNLSELALQFSKAFSLR